MPSSNSYSENLDHAQKPADAKLTDDGQADKGLADDGQTVTVIEPRKGWRMLDFKAVWRYRELFGVLTMRDIKIRYKQTALGVAWSVIQPAMMMIVFTIFFGNLARLPSDGYPYALFVFAGLLPWTFFSNSVASAGNSLVGQAHLVSKVYFPRVIIPMASIGSGLVDFLIAAAFMLGLLVWFGVGWSTNLLAVPILLAGLSMTALGIGMLLSALVVRYRDFRFVIPFLLQFWMFATPVVYPASLVPVSWRPILHLNPLSGLIEGFRSAFLGHRFDFVALAISMSVATLLFVAGVAYFARMERRFADDI